MHGDAIPRRSAIALIAGGALAAVGTVSSQEAENDESISRDAFQILEGTEHETTVYETRADRDGPTVMVVGGIHGDEEAGFVAAGNVAEWAIDTGTLVTIPEANPTAIEAGTRTSADGVNLNRQFPTNEEPQTELAQAIWDVVRTYDPDAVIDLHESRGIYANDPVDGVGQAIFHSPDNEVSEAADRAVDYVNERYIDDPNLEFLTGRFTGPQTEPEGLLVHKVHRETDAIAFLQETLYTNIDLETRVRWQQVLVQQLTRDLLFADEAEEEAEMDEEIDDDEAERDEENIAEDEGPTATIQTDPDGAEDEVLSVDDTVELDGYESSAGAGQIERYRWDVNDDGDYDETEESIEVTLTTCGNFPITLCVTDESGMHDTAEIVLVAD